MHYKVNHNALQIVRQCKTEKQSELVFPPLWGFPPHNEFLFFLAEKNVQNLYHA